MVPLKEARGREAFENIRVYVGNPTRATTTTRRKCFEDTSLDRLSNIKFVSLGRRQRIYRSKRNMVTNTSGKKKTAIARATIRDGEGRVRVDSRPVELVEPELAQLKMLEPFRIAEDELRETVDVDVDVEGGGVMGRPTRPCTAIARALVDHTNDAELRDAFMEFDRSAAGQRRSPVRIQEVGRPWRAGPLPEIHR